MNRGLSKEQIQEMFNEMKKEGKGTPETVVTKEGIFKLKEDGTYVFTPHPSEEDKHVYKVGKRYVNGEGKICTVKKVSRNCFDTAFLYYDIYDYLREDGRYGSHIEISSESRREWFVFLGNFVSTLSVDDSKKEDVQRLGEIQRERVKNVLGEFAGRVESLLKKD